MSAFEGESPPLPLRPSTTYVHTFTLIDVEDSLLRAFTTGKKDTNLILLAQWIFQKRIEDSVVFYEENQKKLDAALEAIKGGLGQRGAPDEKQHFYTMDTFWRTIYVRTVFPLGVMLPLYEETVNYDGFVRVKLKLFVDRHVRVVENLGLFEVPSGASSGAPPMGGAPSAPSTPLYEPLGPSEFPDDLSYAIRNTEKYPVLQKTLLFQEIPCDLLEIAREIREDLWGEKGYLEALLSYPWHPLKNAGIPAEELQQSYSIYCAAVYIMHKYPETPPLFVDLLYYGISAQQMCDENLLNDDQRLYLHYPLACRVFTADDLPDYTHVLWQIPLRGEQDAPTYPLMQMIMKCMPFACQRRQLIELLLELCKKKSFWRLFSKVMWCCLTNAYGDAPHGARRPQESERSPHGSQGVPGTVPEAVPVTDLRKLLRIKQLCDNKTLLLDALSRSSELQQLQQTVEDTEERRKAILEVKKNRENNGLVVCLAFQMYILDMARRNPHYAESAREFIDWNQFVDHTDKMAKILGRCNFFTEDAFVEARMCLMRLNKQEKQPVNRYRKQSYAMSLRTEMDRILENVVYPSIAKYTTELQHMTEQSEIIRRQEYLCLLEKPFSVEMKEFVLNVLVKIQPARRMHPETIALLMDERCGGITRVSVETLTRVLRLFREDQPQKAIRQQLDQLMVSDVRALAWFFGVCVYLERISFAPLHHAYVDAVDRAMVSVRHPLFPGQPLSPTVYDVVYTLCCNRIKTALGKNAFGHKDVAYELQTGTIICNRNSAKDDVLAKIGMGVLPENVQMKKERVKNRDMRFAYHEIPCDEQPVLRFSLKDRVFIVGTKNRKKQWYLRCPRCAGLHQFDPLRFHGGAYCCEDCAKEDLRRPESGSVTMVYQCAYCGVGGARGHMAGQTSRPRVRKEDILLVMDISDAKSPTFDPLKLFTYMRFCHSCYKIAKRYSYRVTKEQLFINLESQLRSSMLYYNK